MRPVIVLVIIAVIIIVVWLFSRNKETIHTQTVHTMTTPTIDTFASGGPVRGYPTSRLYRPTFSGITRGFPTSYLYSTESFGDSQTVKHPLINATKEKRIYIPNNSNNSNPRDIKDMTAHMSPSSGNEIISKSYVPVVKTKYVPGENTYESIIANHFCHVGLNEPDTIFNNVKPYDKELPSYGLAKTYNNEPQPLYEQLSV